MPYGKLALDQIETSGSLDVVGNVAVSGNITVPMVYTIDRPAFLAGINSNTDVTVAVGAAIPANITQYNVGTCYNTSTFRFTAPVAGLYNFTAGIFFSSGGGNSQSMQVGFRRNGSFLNGGSDAYGCITMQPINFTAGICQSVLTAQFSLAANDYVDTGVRQGPLRQYQGHYWFQGYLIG